MLLTPNLGNEMKKSCMGWSHETNSKDTISKEIDVESLIWRSIKNANFKNKFYKHDFRAPYKLVVFLNFFLVKQVWACSQVFFFFFKYLYIYNSKSWEKVASTIKEVVTNRIKKQYIMLFGIVAHRLKAINYNFSPR